MQRPRLATSTSRRTRTWPRQARRAQRSTQDRPALPASAPTVSASRRPAVDWWSAPAERVYLDWNATTPEAQEVLSAMTAAGWANPSSIHTDGRESAKHVLAARGAVAGMTGCPHVTLTSGGSEANALALRGRRVIASILEHASIHPFVTRWIRWDYADLEQALQESPGATVAVQAVNSETGCVQPVARVAALARRYGARVHCDAVQ